VPAAYRSWARTLQGIPTVPLLVLQGTDDGAMQAAYAEHAATKLPATARFELVPRAGHFLQLEQPDTVNELIAEFIGADAG
jgi:pimeloyl-ACP methyl ester carboxylesterase